MKIYGTWCSKTCDVKYFVEENDAMDEASKYIHELNLEEDKLADYLHQLFHKREVVDGEFYIVSVDEYDVIEHTDYLEK